MTPEEWASWILVGSMIVALIYALVQAGRACSAIRRTAEMAEVAFADLIERGHVTIESETVRPAPNFNSARLVTVREAP